jgi:ComEC/Rec2-related protein
LYYIFGFSIGIIISFNVDNITIDRPNKIIQDFPAIIDGKVLKVMKSTEKYQRLLVEGTFDAKALPLLENQRILLFVTGLQFKNIRFESGDKIFAECLSNAPKPKSFETDFPQDKYAASLDVKWIAMASSRNVAKTGTEVNFISYKDEQLKSIQEKIKQLFSAKSYAIVTALLTGDKTNIDYETKQVFSLTGTAHVLAVSGLHVGIIATMIYFLLGFVRLPWLKFAIFSASITLFVIFSGMQASAIRAGIMAILYLLSITSQRKTSAINIISIAILIILIVFPEMLYSVGFHLSIAAISGIALLFQPMLKFFESFIKSKNLIVQYLIASISISLTASIVVSPLVAYYFQVFSIISPLTNLFVIPLMTLSMSFSIIALLLSYNFIPLAEIYASAGGYLIELSLKINNYAVDLPYSFVSGEGVMLISIMTSLGLIYLIYSKKLPQFVFRLASIIIIFMGMFLFENKTDEGVKIIPRQQFVALELTDVNKTKTFLIFDRMPSQKPKSDYYFEKYLNKNKEFTIYYSGNAGLNIVDRIKYKTGIRNFEMDIPFQKMIENKLKLQVRIPQIITENEN